MYERRILSPRERLRPSSCSFVSQEADPICYTMSIRILKRKAGRFITDDQTLFGSELGPALDLSSKIGYLRSHSREFEDTQRDGDEQNQSLEVRESARRTRQDGVVVLFVVKRSGGNACKRKE